MVGVEDVCGVGELTSFEHLLSHNNCISESMKPYMFFYVSLCACVCVRMFVCVYVYLCVCLCVYM